MILQMKYLITWPNKSLFVHEAIKPLANGYMKDDKLRFLKCYFHGGALVKVVWVGFGRTGQGFRKALGK